MCVVLLCTFISNIHSTCVPHAVDICSVINPCLNGGTCVPHAVDICSVINPCLNGGTCTNVSTPTFRSSEKLTTNSSFVCECPEGYYNSLCESEVVILLPVDSDVTPTMDNITIAVVKSTSEPNSK